MPEPVNLGDLIQPMPGRIAVQIETKSERTPTGLFIPVDTARSIHEQRATQGRVVAIGDETDEVQDLDDDVSSLLKLGDTVLFGKYTGTKISWNPPDINGIRQERQEVVIMHEKDVLAILRSPEQVRNLKVKA